MSNLKELIEKRKERVMNNFFGENNYELTNKRFMIKNHIINDDEFVICTNNISYWANKNQFVMWVANNKIVYIKDFQIIPVYNFERLGDCYLVKLNKKHFKSYSCFVNEHLVIDGEDTFDSLKEVAKNQNNSYLWFKFSEDKYGNRFCY